MRARPTGGEAQTERLIILLHRVHSDRRLRRPRNYYYGTQSIPHPHHPQPRRSRSRCSSFYHFPSSFLPSLLLLLGSTSRPPPPSSFLLLHLLFLSPPHALPPLGFPRQRWEIVTGTFPAAPEVQWLTQLQEVMRPLRRPTAPLSS